MLELKFVIPNRLVTSSRSFNRTMLELKYACVFTQD